MVTARLENRTEYQTTDSYRIITKVLFGPVSRLNTNTTFYPVNVTADSIKTETRK